MKSFPISKEVSMEKKMKFSENVEWAICQVLRMKNGLFDIEINDTLNRWQRLLNWVMAFLLCGMAIAAGFEIYYSFFVEGGFYQVALWYVLLYVFACLYLAAVFFLHWKRKKLFKDQCDTMERAGKILEEDAKRMEIEQYFWDSRN